MDNNYRSIFRHYENCYKTHGDNCKGVDWPNEDDVRKRYQVMLDVVRFDSSSSPEEKYSILDFGCGLGHLYDYMRQINCPHAYSGVDISDIFVSECRRKYPGLPFIRLDLLNEDYPEDLKKPDYIILNGVFTEKCDLDYPQMKEFFEALISKVYGLCKKGIAFNVMSKDVDWERDDLFHLPLNELSRFLTTELTRDFIIRNDYGLYEYTTYVYKR